jgi:hypothetical protein
MNTEVLPACLLETLCLTASCKCAWIGMLEMDGAGLAKTSACLVYGCRSGRAGKVPYICQDVLFIGENKVSRLSRGYEIRVAE